MQSINPVVVNSKALKKEAELIFQNNQTCTHTTSTKSPKCCLYGNWAFGSLSTYLRVCMAQPSVKTYEHVGWIGEERNEEDA